MISAILISILVTSIGSAVFYTLVVFVGFLSRSKTSSNQLRVPTTPTTTQKLTRISTPKVEQGQRPVSPFRVSVIPPILIAPKSPFSMLISGYSSSSKQQKQPIQTLRLRTPPKSPQPRNRTETIIPPKRTQGRILKASKACPTAVSSTHPTASLKSEVVFKQNSTCSSRPQMTKPPMQQEKLQPKSLGNAIGQTNSAVIVQQPKKKPTLSLKTAKKAAEMKHSQIPQNHPMKQPPNAKPQQSQITATKSHNPQKISVLRLPLQPITSNALFSQSQPVGSKPRWK